MTGRPALLPQLVSGGFAVFIGLKLFSKFALPAENQLMFDRGVGVAVGALLATVTIWAFVAARRRGLIGTPTIAVALSVSGVLSGLIALDWMLHPARPLMLGVMAIGVVSLVVAPLATAPLALAWNRNR
jgi:hypothetical protein